MFIEAKKKKFIPRMKRKEKFIIIHTLQTNFKQNIEHQIHFHQLFFRY